MKSLIKFKKINSRILSLTLIVLLFFVIIIGWFVYSKDISSSSKNMTISPKTYINQQAEYSLVYPSSYKSKEAEMDGVTDLYLSKDEIWNEGGYNLDKGVFIIVHYNKDIQLSLGFVKSDNRDSFNASKDGKIEERNINGRYALEATYAYSHVLGVPFTTRVYVQNKNDSIELSYTIGENISREEYEQYKKDFNSIVNSVKFLK